MKTIFSTKTACLLCLMVLLLATLTAQAQQQQQQYCVYRVKGTANKVVKKAKTALKKGMALATRDVVQLGEQSELKLFNENDREMVTLKGICAGSIGSLIASHKDARQSMTADYFAFIVKNMQLSNDADAMLAGRSTAIFRDDTDSLIEAADCFISFPTQQAMEAEPAPITADMPRPQPRLQPIRQLSIHLFSTPLIKKQRK